MFSRSFVFAAAAASFALDHHGELASARAEVATGKATAEALFNEGRRLTEAGQLSEACQKFAASERLDPAVGTLLNLGSCNERQGRIASAWANYRDAANLAKGRGERERQEFASRRASALEPRLPKLVVRTKEATPGLELQRDGVLLDVASIGVPLPVDPGPHIVEASARGYLPWRTTASVVEGAVVAVVVPSLAEAPAAEATGVAVSSGRTQRALGVTALAVGGVALGLSAAFALGARSGWKGVESSCPGGACRDQASLDAATRARGQANTATILGSLGGVAAAAGAVLLLTVPSATQAQGFRCGPRLAGQAWGLDLAGEF
jgi:hypothetical protein